MQTLASVMLRRARIIGAEHAHREVETGNRADRPTSPA